MSITRILVKGAALAVALAIAQSAQAVPTPWITPSGANDRFGYSGGQNDSNRLGEPTVTETGFLFENLNDFAADLAENSVADIMNVQVNTLTATNGPAPPIDFIKVVEWGTFGGDIANLSLAADFSIFSTNPLPPQSTGSLILPTDASIFDLGENTWYTEYTLHVGDFGFSNAKNTFNITLNNTIGVLAGSPAGTFFEKTGVQIIVPEPSTALLLLAVAAPVVVRRKSRR